MKSKEIKEYLKKNPISGCLDPITFNTGWGFMSLARDRGRTNRLQMVMPIGGGVSEAWQYLTKRKATALAIALLEWANPKDYLLVKLTTLKK